MKEKLKVFLNQLMIPFLLKLVIFYVESVSLQSLLTLIIVVKKSRKEFKVKD
jgi:hypothetical protein